jgi:acetyl-CoA carboxylase carboxyl transferase subunit alpha
MKIVDRIVPEPAGGAHSDRAAMMATLGDVIAEELDALEGLSPQALKAKRAERFYAIGRSGL